MTRIKHVYVQLRHNFFFLCLQMLSICVWLNPYIWNLQIQRANDGPREQLRGALWDQAPSSLVVRALMELLQAQRCGTR